LHSSQLDRLSPELLEGKKVVVIGSGASAVEVVETALERGSGVCRVLAMDDKVRSFFVVMSGGWRECN
jgi:cation diffusion facilitator CzcD-associated flavoprotein CzcO